MTTKTYESLKEWAEAEPEALRKTVEQLGADGHTIWKDTAFPEVPENLLPVHTYESEGTGKGEIRSTETGERLDELRGVYGLTFLGQLVNALDLRVRGFMGRGFQASAYYKALDGYLKKRGH